MTLTADLAYLLTHPQIAQTLHAENGRLLQKYLAVVGIFQGINPNTQTPKSRYDPEVWISSYLGELDVLSPLTTVLSFLPIAKLGPKPISNLIVYASRRLGSWLQGWLADQQLENSVLTSSFDNILKGLEPPHPATTSKYVEGVSFHLPLHRVVGSALNIGLEHMSTLEELFTGTSGAGMLCFPPWKP